MGAERLENAAAAAGFAMVNPDDFAREAAPVIKPHATERRDVTTEAEPRSWMSWDYFRLSATKATA